MRYDVKKILFVGLQEDKKAFFEKAQTIGIIHFIDLDPKKVQGFPAHLQDTLRAIKVLRSLPPSEQEENFEGLYSQVITQDILAIKNKLDKLEEESRVIKLEKARVEIFGNFSLEDIDYIRNEGGRVFQFYSAKHGVAEKMVDEPNLIYIGSEHGLDYFVGINFRFKDYEGMVEMKIDQPIGKLQHRADFLKNEIKKFEEKLKTYTKYDRFLHLSVIEQMNLFNLEKAESTVQSELNHALFIASGWVPINKLNELTLLAQEKSIQIEEIAIEPTDVVPTFLENHGLSRLGEDLIGIYDTPSTSDKDPSLWVLLFFALFFAFIVGDGGYGAVFFGLTLYFRYKHPSLKGLKKRILNMVTILSVACMVWGLLISSFFGLSLNPDHPLRKASLTTWLAAKKAEYHIKNRDKPYIDSVQRIPHLKTVSDPKLFLSQGYTVAKDGKKNFEILNGYSDAILLELALLVGVIHLCFGLLRYAKRNWSAFGWVAFLIGGYLYFPNYLGVPSMLTYAFGMDLEKGAQFGLYLMAAGVPFAVVVAIIRAGILGIAEIMSVIQVFADALSYLRLYALGLAGSIVSSTINDMADAMPFAIAIVLIIGAHIVNMLLGIVGGLIHGLRLNFLEWYHYSFEGGGKPFKALKLIKPE
ncbi:V-type ATP synthase subunit I [Chlamydiales bacterium STE3]|nr:V-type ATP synthase subunit I [Chlamydiales bacterium STE3]